MNQPGARCAQLSDLSVPALMAALGVFALFGAFSVLFWAYFRFRPARPKASVSSGGALRP